MEYNKIQQAIIEDNSHLLKMLLDDDEIEETYEECTRLLLAAEFNAVNCVPALLKAGERIDEVDPRQEISALEMAIQKNSETMVETLLHYGASTGRITGFQLNIVAKNDSVGILRRLEENGLDLKQHATEGSLATTILHAKARKCRDFLIETMDTDDLLAPEKGTPFMSYALVQMDVITIEAISRKPGFQQKKLRKGKNGLTFLHMLVGFVIDKKEIWKKLRILDILLKENRNINKIDDFGNTALHYCVDIPTAKRLLKDGADLFAVNEKGQTPRIRIKEWDWKRDNSDWLYQQEKKEIERRKSTNEPMPDIEWKAPTPEPTDQLSHGHRRKEK